MRNNVMFLQLSLIDPNSGKAEGFGYIQVSAIVSVVKQAVPSDSPQRQLRGKTLTFITMGNGNIYMTFEPYASVAERLLDLLTEDPTSPLHEEMKPYEAEEKAPLIVGGKPS